MLCYLLAVAGAWLLTVSSQFWHFVLAMVLLLATNSANGSVAATFATDLLDAKTMSRGLPWLNGMTWVGGVIGFAGAGYVIDSLGSATLYHLAMGLSLLAALLVGLLSPQGGVTRPEMPSWKVVKMALAHKKA